jgi:DNA-binding MarR family transcriptional regulator
MSCDYGTHARPAGVERTPVDGHGRGRSRLYRFILVTCDGRPLETSRYNEYTRMMGKGIQSEIQQTKPFASLEDEALVALQRTADRLHWQLAEMLKAHGLSPTQYNALRILRGAGDEGRSCSEIAERMINRDPDITRLVDRLERRGLVVRSREGRDRRVITTRITPTGLELLQSLDRPIEEFNRKLLGHLGEQQLSTLIKLLEAARART